MSCIDDRIDKNILMIKTIINTYILVDQNLKLFKHLLQNEKLLARWQRSYAASGVTTLRTSLYMFILSEMRAIILDKHKKVASVHNIIKSLEDVDFAKQLKVRFCDTKDMSVLPLGDSISESTIEMIRSEEAKKKSASFEESLDYVLSNYQKLCNSELALRVDSARSKMISHKEFQTTTNSERRMFEASDFGLKYCDAEDIVNESREIIFKIYFLFTKSSFDIKHTIKHHELVATDFWSK